MSIEAIPDLLAMLVLMSVLILLRRRYPEERVTQWLLGLSFVLLESVAFRLMAQWPAERRPLHVMALVCYVLAAMTFAWGMRERLTLGSARLPTMLVVGVPLMLVEAVYGLDVKRAGWYVALALAGLVAGILTVQGPGARERIGRGTMVAFHVVLWVPLATMAWQGNLRWAAYWGLACLYLLVAVSFRGRWRRGRVGSTVIMAGFVLYALCFLAHPVVRGMHVYDALAAQVWDMVKFFVTMGMLLMLLEEESARRGEEAMHDALTGLPNRRLFDDRLHQSLEQARRFGKSTALFVLDLNGFKQVNDRHGHQMGDKVLFDVAHRLSSRVRSSDTLARCGGDEFCVVVNEISRREDCERVAEVLREAVAQTDLPEGCSVLIGGSVGYALFPDDASEATALYEVADGRMYADKRCGMQPKAALPRESRSRAVAGAV